MSFNLATLFEAVADADPGREVLVCGERRLTYRQLDDRASRLAQHLVAAGIGPGDTVGLQLVNGTEYIEGMLAAFKIRAIPVNINYRYIERELRHLYTDAGLSALLYHLQFAPAVTVAARELELVLLVVDDDSRGDAGTGSVPYEAALALADPGRPDGGDRSDDDHYLIYTGGTTGLPKGVVWRHEDIFKAAMGGGDIAQTGNYVADERELATRLPETGTIAIGVPPLMHAAAHWLAFHQLFTGGKVILLPYGKFDPALVWTLVGQERALLMVVVGDAIAKPLLDDYAIHRETYDLSSFFVIASSGAPLSETSKSRISALLPQVYLIDSMGSSETGVLGAKQGRAFMLSDVTAVIGEDGVVVAPGDGRTGRVARRGHVPLRYHGDPEKTARTFITVDGVRWALTGDEAMIEEDGSIIVLGRGSQCINTGGEKVYPEEVEEVLKGHATVGDVLVVGVPDDRWGERIVAVVEPEPGALVEFAELQAFARERLAGYKVPRDVVVVDRVVRSPAGKADYRWARDHAMTVLV